jgi:hypothetical protein
VTRESGRYLCASSFHPSLHIILSNIILDLGTARLSLRRLLAAKSDSKPVLRFVRDTLRFPRDSL